MKASSGRGRRTRSRSCGKICTLDSNVAFGDADGRLEALVLRNAASAAAGLSAARRGYQRAVHSIPFGRPQRGSRTAWIDRWIERANQKEAAMGGRLDEETPPPPRRTPARAAGTGGDQRALGKVVTACCNPRKWLRARSRVSAGTSRCHLESCTCSPQDELPSASGFTPSH